MYRLKFFILMAAICLPLTLSSQIKEITFGDIPKEDLEMDIYEPDPGADAVMLENYGKLTMSDLSGVSVIVERHTRIKIINSDGYDYADFVYYYPQWEKVTSVKAATYNLENGEMVTTNLEKKNIYYDKSGGYINSVRFTLPNVRVGSVLEIKYTIDTDDYFSLKPWQIQYDIPVRRGKFSAEIPGIFEYKVIAKGDFKKVRFNRDDRTMNFGSFRGPGRVAIWNYSDIPAYREEPYSTGSSDFITSLDFELSKIDLPGYIYEDISPSYANLSKKLLEKDDFGGTLKNTYFLTKKASELTKEAVLQTDKLRIIHKYVSQNILWNSRNDYTSSDPLRKIFVKEKGNSADVNFILIAMLNQVGIKADPVIMSTRENGYLNTIFATLQQFDYVVARVEADGKVYLVDATDDLRPFNQLPFECLNGQGWVVNEYNSSWIKLRNNESKKSMIAMNLHIAEDGVISGSTKNQYSGYDAYNIRKFIKLQGEDGYIEAMRYSQGNWEMNNFSWESLDSLENSVEESFDLAIYDEVCKYDTKLSFSPILAGRSDSNPFYSEERISPVDFGCPNEDTFFARIVIPEGYVVEEMPVSVKFSLPDKGGTYEYNIVNEDNVIIVTSKVSISTTYFDPSTYDSLRDFYQRVMQKEGEQVVLKKIS